MKENPQFIGRSYDEEEKRGNVEALKKWSEESSEAVEGELEKNEEDLKMIGAVNSIIESELKQLGIETYDPIAPEKIHILPGEVFAKMFPDFHGSAFYEATLDIVYVNKDVTDSKPRVFSTLLHELIHRASNTKFYSKPGGSIQDARVGYRIRSSWKGPERENRLRGFNEVMTDFTVYKVMAKNKELLEDLFGITMEDIQGPIYTYMNYGPILESILAKISMDKGLPTGEVYNDLERGLFSNNILVLKDVEKSFGEGALEILSLLETLKEKEQKDELEKMIKEFFAEEDDSKRQSIRAEILDYVKHANESVETPDA